MHRALLSNFVYDFRGIAREHGLLAAVRDTLALAVIVAGYVIATPRYRERLDDELA